MLIQRRGLTFFQVATSIVLGFIGGVYIWQPFLKTFSKDERSSLTRTVTFSKTSVEKAENIEVNKTITEPVTQ